MAAPIFIAVNQTGSPVVLRQLALTVPASGQVTLSDYNSTSEIQDDAQLKSLITAGTLLISNGTYTLNKDQSLSYCSSGASTVELGDFVDTASASGVITGGEVTATGGTGISVAAGTGLCVRGDPYYDSVKVSWNTTPFTLGSSGYYYVYYDFSAGALVANPVPRIGEDIQLAQVRTDGSAVAFLHRTRTPIYRPSKVLDEYLIDTRRIAHVTGTLASAGTAGRKFQISAGSYYRSLDKIDFAGSGGDATFSYWYGTNGANEVPSQTQVDITNYDNAGTLTAMTAGYWRADSVLITSDGRISVIYGTAQYATEVLAEEALFASIPNKMNSTACTIALLLVQQGNGITKFVDARPIANAAVAGGSGVKVHGALDGLDADDHLQYLPRSGARAMTGNLDVGLQNIVNALVIGNGTQNYTLSKYPNLLNFTYIGSSVETSTTSTTFVNMPDTTYTYAGTATRLLVIAGGDLRNDTSQKQCELQLYHFGAGIPHSLRTISPGPKGYVYETFCIAASIPGWNGAFSLQWRTAGGTLYCKNRYIIIIPMCLP